MADLNVLDEPLQPCSLDPLTGFFRDGCCKTNEDDFGTHIVCARVTTAFLEFSRARGNDLITPHPEWRFPGLKDGDQWCLCVSRWIEAKEAGVAPPVVLECTHKRALQYVDLADLIMHAWRPVP